MPGEALPGGWVPGRLYPVTYAMNVEGIMDTISRCLRKPQCISSHYQNCAWENWGQQARSATTDRAQPLARVELTDTCG